MQPCGSKSLQRIDGPLPLVNDFSAAWTTCLPDQELHTSRRRARRDVLIGTEQLHGKTLIFAFASRIWKSPHRQFPTYMDDNCADLSPHADHVLGIEIGRAHV